MIELKNIKKSFGDKEVIKGVDLNVNEGEVVTLIGRSGSGKTTLLRVGSSNNITFGFIAKALAIATRCCCPPDKALGC